MMRRGWPSQSLRRQHCIRSARCAVLVRGDGRGSAEPQHKFARACAGTADETVRSRTLAMRSPVGLSRPMFQPPFGAVFDWDGVIINSEEYHRASWERLA